MDKQDKDYAVTYIAEGVDPLGILKHFSTSAEGIEAFAALVAKEVEEGRVSPLQVKVWTKTMAKAGERIDELCDDHYKSEAAKYGEKPFSYAGAEIHLTATRTEYDYSACGDPQWNRQKEIVDAATKQLKSMEATLKTYTQPKTIVDEGTGEIATVQPPLKRQSMGLKVSIK